jgi:hypothetical protein
MIIQLSYDVSRSGRRLTPCLEAARRFTHSRRYAVAKVRSSLSSRMVTLRGVGFISLRRRYAR